MKQTLCLALSFSLMALCLWMTVSTLRADRQTLPYLKPDRVESYTVGSFDRLQIQKTYLLSPGETPDRISTEDFQEYGSLFHLTGLFKGYVDGTIAYTAVFTEADPAR